MEEEISLNEINENIRRCEKGEELTRPLAILNLDCNFKKKFEEHDKAIHKEEILKERRLVYYPRQREWAKRWNEKNKELIKAKLKYKYTHLSPEEKELIRIRRAAYYKTYSQRPEVKEKQKLYELRPEVIARKKAYQQNPEVKARYKARREEMLKREIEFYNIAKKKIEEENEQARQI